MSPLRRFFKGLKATAEPSPSPPASAAETIPIPSVPPRGVPQPGLHGVLQDVRLAALCLDLQGHVTFCNDYLADLMGFSVADLVGQSWFDTAVAVDQREAQKRSFFERLREGVRPVRDEAEVTTRSGERRLLSWSHAPLRDDQGRVTGMASIGMDITDSKRTEEMLREAELRFRSVVQAASDGIVMTDGRGGIISWNKGAQAMFGHRPEEVLGEPLPILVVPRHREALRRELERMRGDHFRAAPRPLELEGRKRDGGEFPFELSLAAWKTAEGMFFSGLIRDMTERKRAEAAVRESEERYALAARGANDGLWDWNLRTDEIYYSPRWKAMLGRGEDDVGKSPRAWLDRVHPEDQGRVDAEIKAHLSGQAAQLESEHRVMHADGSYRWVLCRGIAVRDEADKPYRMAGSQTDITERKRAEERLQRDALYDRLTGLANRALFLDRLGHAIRRGKRHSDTFFAVLFLDLDRFKVVNDSLGHVAGDKLLVALGRRLEECLRPGDTIARLGGDEFTILLDQIRDVSEATRVAERIEKALRLPFNLGGQEVFATASIGIALSETGYEGAENVLRDADMAMYRAKALGKARYAVFDPAMHARAVDLLQFETDLRHAIEREELRVHYQPIVALASGRITGFEALVRWERPGRGLVSPADFIPLAEETGLIVGIGRWVLHQACRQLRTWQQEFPDHGRLTVSVNLSPKQFSQPDLIEEIERTLDVAQLSPADLVLEITESVIMENAESAAAMLSRLDELGIPLSIDDFGTGYSSLSYLHRFPLSKLKIDRSFVSTLGDGSKKSEIVRTIAALGLNLGLELVAEGVETEAQLHALVAMGCQYGQGYYFSKPVEAANARDQILAEA